MSHDVYFKASKADLQRIAANAINASEPVGMGFIHYKPGDFKPEDIEVRDERFAIIFDYIQGRMVKLYFYRVGDTGWWRTANDIRQDYQSWKQKYPTGEDLLRASGITEYQFEEPSRGEIMDQQQD